MTKLTFNADDIFEEIEGDPENVMLKIPPEVLQETGWQEGDTLNITVENGALILERKNG